MSLAKATEIRIGDGGGSEVFTEIPAVTALSIDGKQWDTEEITPLGDGSTYGRTHVKTLFTGGNITFTLSPYNGGNTYHALVKTKSGVPDSWNFQVAYPASGGTETFAALVTGFQFQTDVDGVFKANVTLMITGEITVS